MIAASSRSQAVVRLFMAASRAGCVPGKAGVQVGNRYARVATYPAPGDNVKRRAQDTGIETAQESMWIWTGSRP